MSESALDEVTKKLEETIVDSNGVSFQGKSLKLDTEDDCKEIIEEIKACKNLEYLNLEGNTLGVDAAKALSKSLAEHGELKRALWKDMFTGRMKTEIPKALELLGGGLFLAGTQLTELDLSDNAFGPVGVEGLAGLLSSPVCYSLQELRLNNNGLGITGGKMLAKALLECHKKSSEKGKGLALKLFIAGRNRLENEGAKALSKVFQTLGTLEEIAMPQNGIYPVGIKALSESLTKNPNLRTLNLNDNTITHKGAMSIAKALPHLQKLRILNLGDCLLKTLGAKVLANALAEKHLDLEEVHLGYNEIKIEGGLAIAKAMKNKDKLKELMVNGNMFGESGKAELKRELESNQRIKTLGTLSDNESGDDEETDEGEDEEEENEKDEEDNESGNENTTANGDNENSWVSISNNKNDELSDIFQNLSVNDKSPVCKSPKVEKILKMDRSRMDDLAKNKEMSMEFYVNEIIPALMEISSQINGNDPSVKDKATESSLKLYKNIFAWASENEKLSAVNNALFVHLGLIKSEEKNFKIYYDIEGCLAALKAACSEGIIPNLTQQILNCCLDRKKVNCNR